MSNTPPPVDADPRLAPMDDGFRALAVEIVRGFRAMSAARKKRVFHPTSTTVAGSLTVSPMPGAPRNAFFEPGRVLPVIVRFANGVQEDDAAWDNRGATLRVLSPERPDDLDRSLLDLLLTTGRTFSSRAARDFRAWMLGDRSAREEMVRQHPRFGVAAWEMFREIDSYTDVHYFTKVVQSYVDTQGGHFLTRFRLRDPRRPEDAGFLDAGPALLPPDRTSREPGDQRSPTFLHDELRRRAGNQGIDLLLELQVRPVPADPAERDDAVDASRAWAVDAHPWHETGRIHLSRVVANPQIESVAFNPMNAPRELAMLYARTADDPASLNHLRSLVYEVAAAARLGQEPSAALAPLLGRSAGATVKPAPRTPSTPRPRTGPLKVAVVGAGVSGLTTARELTAAGAAVTVFERADEVGGKASSVEIDGHTFDLGAHLCSAAYEQLGAMLEELGIERDDVSPVILYDLEANAPQTTVADVTAEFLRYHTQVRPHLQGILEPGFERHEARFSGPLVTWAANEGVEKLVAATAIGFTASGYGHPSDPGLPALYFLKYAETATFCMDPGTLRYWTPRGGFGNVWKRVADELPDVRCGAEIQAVERDADGVRVRVGGVTHRFDRLVIAAPLHELSGWLDLSAEEAELFSQIRLLDYATVIVSAVGLPRDGFFLVKDHCEDQRSVGHAVAFHHRYHDSDVYVLWAYLEEGMTDEDLLGRLGEDAARLGGRFTTVHGVHRWRYFPHVAPAAMAAGFYRRVTALQGRQHTFYAGSLFNFELVDCNMRHARAIARAVIHEEAAAPAISIQKGLANEPITSPSLPASLEELRRKGEALVAQMQEFLQTLQALQAGMGISSTAARPVSATEAARSAPGSLRSRLDGCGSIEERGGVFVGYLQQLLAQQLDGEVPEPHRGFVQLGLDSLLAVSLYERLHHDTALRLPPTLFYEYTSIASLAEYLAEVYTRERPIARPPTGASAAGTPGGNLRSRLDGCGSASARAGVFVGYLQQLLAEQLEGEVPEAQLGFVQLGLDSLLAVSLYERLHHDTGLRLPPTLFYEYTSIASLAEFLADTYTRERPIARPARPAAGVRGRMVTIVPAQGVATRRLLCFPHAGGAPDFFRRWEPMLTSAGTEVLALDLERPADIQPDDLSAVLDEVWRAIVGATDLPYVVFGHSLGAMLAYEMVCRLQEEGAPLPTHLFVSSFWAPHKAEIGLRTPHFLGEHSPMSQAAVQTWSTSTSAARLGIWPKLLPSWKHVERQPLRVPLTAFQGQTDLMPVEDGAEAWSGYTTAAFTSRIVPGGHFHVADRNSPVPKTLRAAIDTLAAPPVIQTSGDSVHLDGEAWLTRLREGLTRRPGAQTGAWHYYTLSHLARVSNVEAADSPLFPEALERLLAAEAEDSLLFSAHPVFDHVVALTAANTLLRWNGRDGRFAPQIRRLLDRAMSARELSLSPVFGGQQPPYGQAYNVIIILPHKVMLGSESSQILQRAAGLDERTRTALQANARTQARIASLSLSPARIDAVFRGMYKNYEDSWVYFYGEHVLSAEAFESEAARENARRNPGMPMLLGELCARYLEVTRDPLAETALRNLLPRVDDGLRPNTRLFEVASALNYLTRAGVDVARYLPETVQWFSDVLKPWGVGLGPDDPYMDTDTTAFAIYVDQALGLNRISRGAAVFDSRWNEESQEYHHLTNVDVPEMFTTLSILEAYLRDPRISREQQRALWEHSANHLEQRVWIQAGFASPLVLWDKIIQVFFTYEHRFPERPTQSHHRALDLVLSLQEPSGGFRSVYFNEGNPQETAFGLYALKTALAARLTPARREQVRGAAAAAERFLARSWANTPAGFTGYQCQGIAKLTCNAPNAIEALIIGALLMPWPETERRS